MTSRHTKTHKRFYGRSRELKHDRKMSRVAGLPPGTLVHVGEQRTGAVRITEFRYNEHAFKESTLAGVGDITCQAQEDLVYWVNIDGLHDVDLIQALGERIGIHPLVLEDIVNTNQRPKVEDYGNYLYIVLKMLYMNGNGDGNGNGREVVSEQVSLILGPNYVISFQERPGDVFDVIRDRIRFLKGRVRKAGADYLAYALLDAIVDNYFVILEHLGEAIDDQEELLIANPTLEVLEKVHALRGEMFGLRRSVWPLREVIGLLARGENPLLQAATGLYLRDLYDHTIQVIDTIETYRDILASMMDIYLSSASNRLNEVMKVLTIFSTIFIPLSFIVGLYGMNFKYMPELDKPWGYPMCWGIMLLTVGAMVWFFKRRRWF